MNSQADDRVLAGVRVFELGIGVAGPVCGRYLAHHGAEVFKIESPNSPDVVRLVGSAWLHDDEELGPIVTPDSSPYVSEMNVDKRSVSLDLKDPAALEAAKKLIQACDVMVVNFTNKAVCGLGLDYESVRAFKEDIVYVEMPGFGIDKDAPYYPYVAWGPNQAPLVGIDDLTGHAGREPAGIATVAPPDYFSGFHGTFVVAAGLEHRDRTGEGVHVHMSQFEATVALLGPFMMNHALTGESQSRIGNRSLWGAPEGVYPCRGEERWIAISASDDEAWALLDDLAGLGWASDARFATGDDRAANFEALDDAIAAWTAGFSAEDLAARLQVVGVAAHIVSTNGDLLIDTHVMDRGWYYARPNARFTRDVYGAMPAHMTATPGTSYRAGPSSGEHTVEVLTEVAGMAESEVQALIEAGVAFTMAHPDVRIDRPYEDWLHVLLPNEAEDTRDLEEA